MRRNSWKIKSSSGKKTKIREWKGMAVTQARTNRRILFTLHRSRSYYGVSAEQLHTLSIDWTLTCEIVCMQGRSVSLSDCFSAFISFLLELSTGFFDLVCSSFDLFLIFLISCLTSLSLPPLSLSHYFSHTHAIAPHFYGLRSFIGGGALMACVRRVVFKRKT